jgi:hypothetical protein
VRRQAFHPGWLNDLTVTGGCTRLAQLGSNAGPHRRRAERRMTFEQKGTKVTKGRVSPDADPERRAAQCLHFPLALRGGSLQKMLSTTATTPCRRTCPSSRPAHDHHAVSCRHGARRARREPVLVSAASHALLGHAGQPGPRAENRERGQSETRRILAIACQLAACRQTNEMT